MSARRAGVLGAALAGLTLAALAPGPSGTVRAASAASPETLFDQGNTAYRAGHFDQAAAAYEEILAYGIADPRVDYNLGNAYFKMGKLGPAIVQYERALRLQPSDQEIRDNLDLARGQIRDLPPEPELQYPIRVARDTLATLPPGPLALCFLLLWLAATGLAGVVPFVRSWDRRRAMVLAVLALGLLALTAGAAVAWQVSAERRDVAIVLPDKVDVRSGPGDENTVLFTVHEGTRLDLGNRLDRWVQVSLPNGLSGWVPTASVEKV